MAVKKWDIRTDLALEERESYPGDGGEISGVSLREWRERESSVKVTEVKILNEQGQQAMGKPCGTYLTLEADGLAGKDEDYHREVSEELARHIRELAGRLLCGETAAGAAEENAGEMARSGKVRDREAVSETEQKHDHTDWTDGDNRISQRKILVAGLGNSFVTPDALGPKVVSHLEVTRHLNQQYGEGFLRKRKLPSISGIVPGVMAQTGMETAEIMRGIIRETKPDLLIAVDALAARSIRRLGTTIQLTDTGIHPGSGVGNHRNGLTRESLGIPVLAIGVPTVVGAAAIAHDTVNVMIRALSDSMATKGMADFIRDLEPDGQYGLIRELLEPEFGSLYVTPPNIDEMVGNLSFTISEGIHMAVFP